MFCYVVERSGKYQIYPNPLGSFHCHDGSHAIALVPEDNFGVYR